MSGRVFLLLSPSLCLIIKPHLQVIWGSVYEGALSLSHSTSSIEGIFNFLVVKWFRVDQTLNTCNLTCLRPVIESSGDYLNREMIDNIPSSFLYGVVWFCK